MNKYSMANNGTYKVHKQTTPGGEIIEPYENPYRWVMLALVWVLYCVFGIVMRSIAPLVTSIIEDLSFSYSQMGIISGSWTLPYIAAAVIGGAIIDRWGIRKSLFIGIAIITLSEFLRYFAGGFTSMFIIVALFGFGGPMISIGCPKTISLWFRGKERGIAVGVYMTGTWIGALIAYSMTNSVIMPLTGYSWRLTFVFYSLLGLAATLVWLFSSRDIKATGAIESTSIIKVFTRIMSVRNVQLIVIMGFLSLMNFHGIGAWLPKILEAGGLPPVVSGFAASIPLVVSIPTLLVVPRLVAPRLRGRVLALMSCVTAVSLLVIASASGVFLVMGLVFYGLTLCCVTPLLMLILMDIPEVGPKYMGSAAGIFFCVAEIGGFVGPLIIGAIKDITGSFLVGAFFIAGTLLIMSIMALLIRVKPA